MQNHKPPSGFFGNKTGAAKGDDDWRINSLDIFLSSHSFKTTKSVLDIEYNGPHVCISPSFRRASWSMPGLCGGNQSTNILLTKGRTSWYCSGTTTSRGCFFKFFCLSSIIDIVEWCLKYRKYSSLNCLKEGWSIKHNNISSKGSLWSYLRLEYILSLIY